MRPSDLATTLTKLLPTRQPIYVWGPPGVGKSSVVHQATEANDLQMCDVRAVLLDPVDLRGLPRIDADGRAQWCPPAFLPKEGNGVLFLDELAQAPPLVQAACLQLTLDRRVGEYELPEGWTIVAASNRQEDRAGAHRLITPLLNRFIHLDMEVSNEDWHAWAIQAGVQPEVRSFIHFRHNLLHHFDPASGARSFPTPRSWKFVSDVLPHTPRHVEMSVYAGCVGDGPAAEFVAFARIYRDLPDVDQVLANPKAGSVPKEPAILYALSGAIAERARKGDAKLLGNIVNYANRMPDEFSVLTVKDATAANKNMVRTPECQQWLKAHRDVMLGAA